MARSGKDLALVASAQSATVPPFIHLDHLRGGRSGLNPFDLLPGQVAEAYNVDPYDGMCGRKRPGADSLVLTGGTAFTGPMNALARWVPGTDDTAAEMWGIDSAATPIIKRLAAGVAWADVTPADVITSRAQDACFAALNGKQFVAFKSGAARLHVYDPTNFAALFFSELVGDGGGGASCGGGGGAGAVVTASDTATLVGLNYVQGPGGTAGTAGGQGGNGTGSTFNARTAGGGGGGGGNTAGQRSGRNGANGSCGGGGGSTGAAETGGTGSAPGTNGGASSNAGTFGAGAGGGAGAVGAAGSGTNGGIGGTGVASTVPGSASRYAGGGGGGIQTGTAGTATDGGGAGTSTSVVATSGTANSGGGGGGSGFSTVFANGGAGGSGRLTVWYRTGSMVATGGVITTSGLFTIHTFTASGTFTIISITPNLRRVGLAPGTNAPTAANAGGGAYAATGRYYRVRWLHMNGVIVVRRSEYTPASALFTPSGAGASVTVTQPTPPGEGETHWEVEVSLDGVTYYVLAGVFGVTLSTQVAIGTTTYSDSTVTTSYSLGRVSDPSGYYQLPHSAKFLVTDGNRLLWAGDNDGVQPGSRVWFSPVLGSADKGDDERWVLTNFQRNYIDLGTKDGGDITGMSYPINGVIYVFKTKSIWGLFPTSNVNGPYVFRKIRDDIGCGDHKTITTSKDIGGKVVIMWWDQQTGPWRVSAQNGFEYIGRDVEDITKRVNLAATNRVAHAVWHSTIHQWWVWLALDAGNDPSVKMVFDPHRLQTDEEGLLRGGWYYHDGDSAAARCSCLFSNTVAATMSRDLKPYAGLTNGAAKVYKCDSPTATDDAGTAFQAYIDTAPIWPPLPNGVKLDIGEPIVTAKASAATVKITIEGDFGADGKTVSGTASLAAAGAETRVFRKFGDVALADLTCLQVRLGDSAAVASAWTIDRVSIPVTNAGTA